MSWNGRSRSQETEQRVEQVVGTLLQYGVLFATLFVAIGGGLYLIRHGLELPDYHIFRGEPRLFRTPDGVATAIEAGRYRGVIQFGVMLLIATPIARVVMALLVFVYQRDRVYIGGTLIVLVGLLASVFAGSS